MTEAVDQPPGGGTIAALNVPDLSNVIVPNLYKVPKRKWDTWTTSAKYTFNRVYGVMRGNQHMFAHPGAVVMDNAHWTTIAWNAAFMAADSVMQ